MSALGWSAVKSKHSLSNDKDLREVNKCPQSSQSYTIIEELLGHDQGELIGFLTIALLVF
jgi:hypothetical protein